MAKIPSNCHSREGGSFAVAFPGRPKMVLARFLASLAASMVVGLIWSRVGREAWMTRDRGRLVEGDRRWAAFTETARQEFPQAGGWPGRVNPAGPGNADQG